MKEEAEALVNDVKIYSEGLILAIQKNNFNEAEDYLKKTKTHLDSVKSYLKMKKKLK